MALLSFVVQWNIMDWVFDFANYEVPSDGARSQNKDIGATQSPLYVLSTVITQLDVLLW